MIKPTFLFVLLLSAAPLIAGEDDSRAPDTAPDPNLCFNFKKRVDTPLRPLPPLDKNHEIKQGGLGDGTEWGSGRGLVPRSIGELRDWLLDHTNWKDKNKTDIVVKDLVRPGYFAFHEVAVDVTVFAFISISWVEQWAYALVSGTMASPKKIVVSYQKVSGTSHLESLCGSVVLQKVSDNVTDVYLYEQAKAGRYKADDMAKLQIANLKVLRDPATVMKPPPPPVTKPKD